ncbi:MAG: serine hydrolase [Actinomycetota bacterium]
MTTRTPDSADESLTTTTLSNNVRSISTSAVERVVAISPPTDDEVWSYVSGSGKHFLRFSAVSRVCLGLALVFLSFRGNWLVLLLPFAIGIVLGGLINLLWSTQIPDFDRGRHLEGLKRGPRRQRSDGAPPTVDVFICTCGEDPAVVENTIVHATALDYEGEVTVYVLDDRDVADVRRAAELWGAVHIARPNQGWMKKAGNLHHAYGMTEGDLILVLDADFAVRPDFLRHTVPYFDDDGLGILQTPQYFRTAPDNWVERGAAAQQEQFYRVGMRARDKHGGAICVGTNAVYRRDALDERGGMALLEHSEDIFTGMKVVDAGRRVDYLPLPLAAGSTPDSTEALASQQYRWARGNFALAGTPLFKRMKLTPMQRLGLWDGWIFYVTSALSPIVALFVPIVTLAEAPYAITLAPTAMILPALFTEFYLMPRWLHLPDGQASRRVGLISQVAHLYALRDHLTDRDQEWIPTGGSRRPGEKQGTDRIPDQIATAAIWGFVITAMLLAFRLATGWPIVDLAPVGVLCAIALPAALGTTRAAVRPTRRRERRRPVTVLDPHTSDPAADTAGRLDDAGRDSFLDVVRAISIVRVVFWHALGFWWISWTFAAMPAVFYVSGAVLAKSLRRHAPTIRATATVVGGRLRRLALPYLAFVVLVLSVVSLAVPSIWTRTPADAISWLVPYRAPAPLAWEDGWLSTPLWFLRALVIVLVLTPLLRPIGRLIPGPVLFVAWLGSLVALDLWVDTQPSEMATAVARGAADVVCFGGFFALGFAGHTLRYRLGRPFRFWAAGVLGAAAIALAVTVVRPTDMVVNNSYVLFGLVGLAWLAAMLGLEDHLRHLGELPAIRAFVGWITSRAMTIYLWHTFALIVAYRLVGAPTSLGSYAMLGAMFAVLLPVVVAAMRPLESLGSRRERGGAPVRTFPVAVVAVALALTATQATLFPTFTDAVGPPTPSGRPPTADAAGDAGAGRTAPPVPSGRPVVSDEPIEAADDAAAADAADADRSIGTEAGGTDEAAETVGANETVEADETGASADAATDTTDASDSAASVSVRQDAAAWLTGVGVESAAVVEIGTATGDEPELVQFGDPDALDPTARFEALSLTKTMVAAVALDLVDQGVIGLDDPLPDVAGVDRDVTRSLTLRRLLSHASGFGDYRDQPDYREDSVLEPIDAVNLSAETSDLGVTEPNYAAPNYLLAGLVIEELTGESLADALERRLFEPLDMDDTELVNNQREGFVGHGSGGVVSTLDDLARWYDALLRQGDVISDRMRLEMLFGGREFQPNAGLGAWRHCPCDPPTYAEPEPFLYAFHDGGDARLVYIPSRDTILAMRFSSPLYGEDRIVDDVVDFTFAVADRRS